MATIAFACEEVIDIDLNEARPEIVIEAVIFKDSTLSARISRTTSYFVSSGPEFISDATVSISNDDGDSEVLLYQGNGYYRGSVVSGTEDTNYEIEILYDGKLYISQSYMPPATEIVSLESKRMTVHSGPRFEPMYELECKFTERPDTSDYFLLRYIQNDILRDERYTLASDFNSEDGIISYSPGMYIFEAGDSVEVQIYSIDKNVFDYFVMMNDAMSGMSMFSTPYNPRTNINNAILGYFAAWSFVSGKIIVE